MVNMNYDDKYFGYTVYEYSLKMGINDGFFTPFKKKNLFNKHR